MFCGSGTFVLFGVKKLEGVNVWDAVKMLVGGCSENWEVSEKVDKKVNFSDGEKMDDEVNFNDGEKIEDDLELV